jgi:hypothetical protein
MLRRNQGEFPVWTARTRTPATHVAAIRSLQITAPAMVKQHSRSATMAASI